MWSVWACLSFASVDCRHYIDIDYRDLLHTVLLRTAHFQVPQTRKRLYIVLIRKDICGYSTVADIGEVAGKVLSQAMRLSGRRPTIGELMSHNRTVLNMMDATQTDPPPSKDQWFLWQGFCQSLPVTCGQVTNLCGVSGSVLVQSGTNRFKWKRLPKKSETICKFDFVTFLPGPGPWLIGPSHWQDGRTSKAAKNLVTAFKKELGVAPHGCVPSYCQTKIQGKQQLLNQRERDCLDVHYASLLVTCLFCSLCPAWPITITVPGLAVGTGSSEGSLLAFTLPYLTTRTGRLHYFTLLSLA